MPPVRDRLFERFYEFDFFQAVRVLERVFPARKPVGLDFAPADEIVRFRPHLSLAFPPAQIVALDPPTEDRPVHLATVTFFGLYGVNGALPTHYTQMMMDLVRDLPRSSPERRALRDWLDLFNHRLISLFYRAWEKYRFHIAFERGEAKRPDPDAFTLGVRSLMGLGSAGTGDRLAVSAELGTAAAELEWAVPGAGRRTAHHAPRATLARIDDLAVLYYAGFFAQRPRNAANLRAMLADYFRLPVEVGQFRGGWLAIPADRQSQLGTLGTLGVDAVAGDRVWDVTARFRVRLGPLDYPTFEDLLPDRSPVRERKTFFLVAQLARLFVGPELDFDVQLVLDRREVPEAHLTEGEGAGPRLGWNVWLISGTPADHADDAVFEGEWVTSATG
jgi:type VI secretion system protein ImpH